MIDIAQPAMGLNDRVNHHIHVQMWNTYDVSPDHTAEHIANCVVTVARSAEGGRLRNVVFSCHGGPAQIQIGQGFNMGNIDLFSRWRGLVDKIWIRCCQVAYIAGTGPAATNDGNIFCSRMAQQAACYVVASTELQVGAVGRVLPYGQIDTYEGLVLCYGPSGNITWQHRYPSTYRTPPRAWGLIPENWHQNPD